MDSPFKIIRRAVSLDVCHLLKVAITLTKDVAYYLDKTPTTNINRFVDHQSPNSFRFYGLPVTDALLLTLQPLMQFTTGKQLLPVNSYGRIYWKGSVLPRHRDREGCEFSATLCVYNDPAPWTIFMGGTAVDLEPGDLVVYQGYDVEHWREPYTGTEQVQVFLHYVNADGPFASEKFDKRPLLGMQK